MTCGNCKIGAVTAIRQGENKAIIGFWLSELARRFLDIGLRPEYVLSGTVIIRPERATTHAQLARADRNEVVSVFEASSSEAAVVKIPTSLSLPRTRSTTKAVAP